MRTAALLDRLQPRVYLPAPGQQRSVRVSLSAVSRSHWVFLTLLAAGALLRLATQLAYRPALLYIDSFRYIDNLHALSPTRLEPLGYDLLLLGPLLWLGHLALVPAVQHLLGLGMSVMIYALLTRQGVPRPLAALACAPVLLDAYQLQIEQNVMSDTLFQALLVATLAVLTWRRRPGYGAMVAAGLLLAAAVLVRLVGEPLVLPAVVYALVAVRGPWRRRVGHAAALAACFVAPLVGYATYFYQFTGTFGLSDTGGNVLYGRAAVIADCQSLGLPPYERVLCPSEPRGARYGADYYAHDPRSPAQQLLVPPPGMSPAQVRSDFARRVIAHQPLDFMAAVAGNFGKGFAPTHTSEPSDVPAERWQFRTDYPHFSPLDPATVTRVYGGDDPTVSRPLAEFLRGYQLTVGYTPGPVLAAALLAGLLAVMGVGRRRKDGAGTVPRQGGGTSGAGAGRAAGSGMRAACLLYVATGAGVLLTAAVFEFSWRYQLPGLVLLPLAGALGVHAMTRRRPWTRGTGRLLDPFPDEVDRAALRDFHERYADARLAPVVIVIAAYNEALAIGRVLDRIPARYRGMAVDTLVSVDGATDATAEVARAHGAYTCVAPVNRGQGAALRLGYHVAREGGARYIVTTDADGQYDIGELSMLLDPLVADQVDFVTGSRRLGRQETTDPVRHLGVRVFAWLVSALTRHRVTDTSFGFRAMKAHVTASVTLAQPQYQSSELLIGVIARGFRVVEQPMTMRVRASGRSKKGNNLVYGMRYARVVLGTWLRERPGRAGRPRASGSRAVDQGACHPRVVRQGGVKEPSRRN